MTEEMKKEETVNETADTAENAVEQDETVQEPEAEAKTETAAEDETKEESDALDEADVRWRSLTITARGRIRKKPACILSGQKKS